MISVLRDPKETRVLQDRKDPRAILVRLDRKERKDRPDPKAHKDHKERRDPKAHRERKVQQDQPTSDLFSPCHECANLDRHADLQHTTGDPGSNMGKPASADVHRLGVGHMG